MFMRNTDDSFLLSLSDFDVEVIPASKCDVRCSLHLYFMKEFCKISVNFSLTFDRMHQGIPCLGLKFSLWEGF